MRLTNKFINRPLFSGQEFGRSIVQCTHFCYQQMFKQNHLDSTSSDAHTVGCQMHVDLTILQYSIFNSMSVFFTGSFAWASKPGLTLKTSCASTKLSSPTHHHGIWWHIFTIYNTHSLQLNVLQCQKFCDRTKCIFLTFVVLCNQLFSIHYI